MAADHCETETEDPSSLTELHLSISDLFLEEQSVKYTDIQGVLPSIQMGHGCRALCLDLGGEGESLISHLTPQVSPRVYSPRNCLHAS